MDQTGIVCTSELLVQQRWTGSHLSSSSAKILVLGSAGDAQCCFSGAAALMQVLFSPVEVKGLFPRLR